MIMSVVISIPWRGRDAADLPARAIWLVNQLAGEQVIAKLGHSVVRRGARLEVAGVLAYCRTGWDVLGSSPARRALASVGIEPAGLRAEVAPAIGFDDDTYCGARVRGELELFCDVLTGMPPLRLADSKAYVASHRLRLSDDTHAELSMWDEAYRRVYMTWLNSGMYERWAEREIFRRDSELNRSGRAVARKVAKDTGLKVSAPAGRAMR